MEIIMAVVVLASLGVGFGAGWGLKPDSAAEALAEQTRAIEALQEGQTKLVESASKPVVIDAELKATLAEIPVQCQKDMGGDPNSVPCQWATCLQFGQSSAQRPECSGITTLLIDSLRKPSTTP